MPRGSRRWRVPAHEIRDDVDALVARGVRYSAARDLLPQRLAHQVLLQMERSGDSPDDRVQDTVARSAPVTAYVRALWPALDPAGGALRAFSDAAALAAAADGILTDDEQRMLLWDRPPRTKGAARWTRADRPSSTRSPTCSTAPRAWVTSCSTRPRTSPRCSCAPSAVARRPGR